ncbi:complement C3 [Patella vulgata]|uniref:complement C3 n=1 Tax=Patella vulgata TaxID=6465 RepID=UPI00217FE22F|nr:complement C3 [Patella vulgata]
MDYQTVIIVLVGFISLISTQKQSFYYVVITPKIFRTDTDNVVTISASDVTKSQTVHLILSYGEKPEQKQEQKIKIEKDGVQNTTFRINSSDLPPTESIVSFEVRDDMDGPKQDHSIPVDRTSGHIMIQTDKPIYKPRETVKYRILAVNEDQSPTTRSVRVDITSPNGIILDRMTYPGEEAFNGKTFFLPKEAQLGVWNISASFVGDEGVQQTVEFEVKEYVLPTFNVEIKPEMTIMKKSLRYININVEAKYSYGKVVEGHCDLRMGVVNDEHVALFKLPEKKQTNRLSREGMARFMIPTQDLARSSLWFPEDGKHLYIEASVTEKSTGMKVSQTNTSIVFVTNYYNIEFTSSKDTFKPGMPYRLEIDVRDIRNGNKSNLSVYINATFTGKTERKNLVNDGKSDSNGRISQIYQIPDWCHHLQFVVSEATSLDPKLASQETKSFAIRASDDNKISLAENIKHRDTSNLDIKIAYEHKDGRTMFILVFSKGQVIYTTSFTSVSTGQSKIEIPESLRPELSPFARIIVYYLDSDQNEVKAESIIVHFPSRCLEELNVTFENKMIELFSQPKKNVKIKVDGGNNTKVGVVIVDKAVYYLNNRYTLTRDKMFSLLGKRDADSKIVQSRQANKTFKENGLLYFDNFHRKHYSGYSPIGGLGFEGVSYARDPIINVNRDDSLDLIPIKKIRKYFPESWYFEDFTLSDKGRETVRVTLPDSITKWVVWAVGLSSNRGVCVAEPREITAYQPVFIQLHLPYKAVRLEQVKVTVTMFNYKDHPMKVKINYTGDVSLCLPNRMSTIKTTLKAKKSRSTNFFIIPLKTGDLTIRVGVWDITNRNKENLVDVVEKQLYVVPEGKRLRKTITFALDPEGNKISRNTKSTEINISDTPTINHTLNVGENTQKTEVDLALPVEIIPGTEDCAIQACGDLMGDIITGAMAGKGNIFVSSFHMAEEVIGNMAPVVHALQYLNSSALLNKKMFLKGRNYITQGITRLMKFRNKNGSYSLYEDSPPITWLTSLVLKTLCHAKDLSYVDKELINTGFLWLLDQVDEEGRPANDQITPEDSHEYAVMLAAEILIALKECEAKDMLKEEYFEDLLGLEIRMLSFIEENIDNVSNSMALSKMAYALQLSDSPDVDCVVKKMVRAGKSSSGEHGVTYWTEHRVSDGKPYWYRQSADAFSIESTAYALLVYIRHRKLDPHSLADWLIRQRNAHGGFVSPTDTAIAIQALAEFSSLKHSPTTDLRLEISSDSSINYNHVIAFNQEDAIDLKYLMDVPVGEKINLKTNGTGLGQVQINVAYNVPTAPNDNCMYELKVTRKRARIPREKKDNETSLCNYCTAGCRIVDKENDEINTSDLKSKAKKGLRAKRDMRTPPGELEREWEPLRNRRYRDRHETNRQRNRDRQRDGNRRRTRANRRRTRANRRRTLANRRRTLANRRKTQPNRRSSDKPSVSSVTLCLEICLRYRGTSKSGPTRVEIDMLSGFEPITEDLNLLKSLSEERVRTYRDDYGLVIIYLDEVPNKETLCLNFRIKEKAEEIVKFRQPASVVVVQPSKPEEICLQNYDSGNSEDTLPMYCIGEENRYKGECTCFSGECGTCHKKAMGIAKLKDIFCKSDYAYQVVLESKMLNKSFRHVSASLKSAPIKGTHDISEGKPLSFTTSPSCTCPNYKEGSSVWVMGKNPYRFINQDREEIYRYIIDESTTFLSVTARRTPESTSKSYFNIAINSYDKDCEN